MSSQPAATPGEEPAALRPVEPAPAPRRPDVNSRAFRDVAGRFATGVSVMTTVLDGDVHGMTINAFASVSLDPLLVLVCVERNTLMATMVQGSGVFALSFLAEDQQGLSIHFADPFRPLGRLEFESIRTHPAPSGCPLIDGAIGWFDCRVWDLHEGGDHVIVLGEPLALGVGTDAEPLLFFRGAYRQLRAEGT